MPVSVAAQHRLAPLFTMLVKELVVHEKIEKQIFYPRVKEQATTKKLEKIVTESFDEHHFVNVVIAEEGEMFPKVRKIFSKAELEEMGTEMEELKQQLMEQSPEEQPTSQGRPGKLDSLGRMPTYRLPF